MTKEEKPEVGIFVYDFSGRAVDLKSDKKVEKPERKLRLRFGRKWRVVR